MAEDPKAIAVGEKSSYFGEELVWDMFSLKK